MKKKLDVFSPIIIFPVFFIAVFFGGYSITSIYFRLVGSTLQQNQLSYYTAGLGSYIVGVVTAFSIYKPGNQYNARVRKLLSGRRFWLFVLPLFLVASLFMTYRLFKVGIPFLNYDPELERAATQLSISGYVSVISLTLQVVLVFALIYRFVCEQKGSAISFLIGISFVLLILTGSRNRVIIPLAIYIICFNYLKHRMSAIELAKYILFLALFFIAFGWIRTFGGSNRYVTWQVLFKLPRLLLPLVSLLLGIMNSSLVFNQIVTYIPTASLHQNGKFLFSGITAILPGYQPSQGILIKDIAHIANPNPIGISLLGTLWVDFGLIGIVAGMCSVGFFLGGLYKRMIGSGYRFYYTILYGYFIVYFVLTLYSGLFESFTDVLFPIVFAVIAKLIGKKAVIEEELM